MKSNICFFCKQEFDKHSKDDIQFCLDKFLEEYV